MNMNETALAPAVALPCTWSLSVPRAGAQRNDALGGPSPHWSLLHWLLGRSAPRSLGPDPVRIVFRIDGAERTT
jgi:hypothetical protein